ERNRKSCLDGGPGEAARRVNRVDTPPLKRRYPCQDQKDCLRTAISAINSRSSWSGCRKENRRHNSAVRRTGDRCGKWILEFSRSQYCIGGLQSGRLPAKVVTSCSHTAWNRSLNAGNLEP